MLLQCGNRTLDLSSPKVMGVLNVTPDSFSDGGQFNSIDAALTQAERMVKDGASIIDVGGESTRPGAADVSAQEELDRVIPVIEVLSSNLDVVLSVDTSTPEVISSARAAGAHLINDVRALQKEGALKAAVEAQLPVCLMHMQGKPETMQANPEYGEVNDEVHDFLRDRIKACHQAGISLNQILIDPGFGFGKTLEHNIALLSELESLKALGAPILVGLSRKSMIGSLLNDRAVDGRLHGSISAATIAALRGADVLRVHDVKETVDALKIVAAVKEFEK